jgi:hypothetical protein
MPADAAGAPAGAIGFSIRTETGAEHWESRATPQINPNERIRESGFKNVG